MPVKEYPTLTALMADREPGSVKVLHASKPSFQWIRPARSKGNGTWYVMGHDGWCSIESNDGPWLIVSEDATAPTHTHRMTWFGGLTGRPVSHLATYEVPCPDAPALDTLRLEIAAKVLASLHAGGEPLPNWDQRHAYALAEADALIKEARKC